LTRRRNFVNQALSAKFRNRLKIAVVSKSEKKLASLLNVSSYPALRVIPAGSTSQNSEVAHFTGKVSLFAVDLFLMDFARPTASEGAAAAPSEQARNGKTSKSRDVKDKETAGSSSGSGSSRDKPSRDKQKPADKPTNAANAQKGKGGKNVHGGDSSIVPPVFGDEAKKERREKEFVEF
jgi:hypothetical protein